MLIGEDYFIKNHNKLLCGFGLFWKEEDDILLLSKGALREDTMWVAVARKLDKMGDSLLVERNRGITLSVSKVHNWKERVHEEGKTKTF